MSDLIHCSEEEIQEQLKSHPRLSEDTRKLMEDSMRAGDWYLLGLICAEAYEYLDDDF